MKITRRDLLAWGAGAAAGLIVTPVPWKVVDDISIWSQNWPWIPQPARVPVEVKPSFCSLCPNGCGLRVRMANGSPVGVAGLGTHPVSRGALCPLAFGAHQLNWHPQRLRSVHHRGAVSSWNEAQAAFAKARKEGPMVVIDGYPGRADSSILEEFAHQQGGSYRVAMSPELRALAPYEEWTRVPASSLGYDLENASTIVSFGVPLLDGWGMPGRCTRLWVERAVGKDDPKFRLIQVEPSLSRTASKAWQWIAVREGSESVLAAGLARLLLEQNLVPARAPIPAVTLSEVTAQTGVPVDKIRDLARTVAAGLPAVAIAADEDPCVAALNVVLGAVGKQGGVVRRSKIVKPYLAAELAISEARAVLIDSSVPWDFTPKTDAEIFRFAAWNGGPANTDWLLPAPGFLEDLTDIPSAPTAALETYAIAPALIKPNADVRSAAQFLRSLDPSLHTRDLAIQTRCIELVQKRAGSLYAQDVIPIAKIASAKELEQQLRDGAVWMADASPTEPLRCELKQWPLSTPSVSAQNWSSGWREPVLPPLFSKLCIESTLREVPAGRTL